MPIGEIATLCGYGTERQLYRSFAIVTGQPPSFFRSTNRGSPLLLPCESCPKMSVEFLTPRPLEFTHLCSYTRKGAVS